MRILFLGRALGENMFRPGALREGYLEIGRLHQYNLGGRMLRIATDVQIPIVQLIQLKDSIVRLESIIRETP